MQKHFQIGEKGTENNVVIKLTTIYRQETGWQNYLVVNMCNPLRKRKINSECRVKGPEGGASSHSGLVPDIKT